MWIRNSGWIAEIIWRGVEPLPVLLREVIAAPPIHRFRVRLIVRVRVRVRSFRGAKPMLCWSSNWKLPPNLRSQSINMLHLLRIVTNVRENWMIGICWSIPYITVEIIQVLVIWMKLCCKIEVLLEIFDFVLISRIMKRLQGFVILWNYLRTKSLFCGLKDGWRRLLLTRGSRYAVLNCCSCVNVSPVLVLFCVCHVIAFPWPWDNYLYSYIGFLSILRVWAYSVGSCICSYVILLYNLNPNRTNLLVWNT